MKERRLFQQLLKYLVTAGCVVLLFGGIMLTAYKQQSKVSAYAAEEGVTDFVSRLYMVILDREADADGLDSWVSQLTAGTKTGVDVTEGFILSEEFLAKNLSNEDFVKTLYRAFFDREADEEGLTTWLGYLEQGYVKEYIFKRFAGSDEFKDLCDSYNIERGNVVLTQAEQTLGLSEREYAVWEFVERFYVEFLGRSADYDGLKGWADKLLAGTLSGVEAAEGFFVSEEFRNKVLTNEEYVHTLYRAFFNRPADEGGLEKWTGRLAEGYVKKHVFGGLAVSDEFEELCKSYGIERGEVYLTLAEQTGGLSEQEFNVWQFVERFYMEVLGRVPDLDGLKGWANKLLDKTASGAEVAEGFIFSDEFVKKNPGNEDYVKIMYRAFFGREADTSGLASWMDRMANGETREQVFAGFVNSEEFGELCKAYGIEQGEVKVPEPEENTVVTSPEGIKFELTFDESGKMTEQKYYSAEGTLLGTNVMEYNADGTLGMMFFTGEESEQLGRISYTYQNLILRGKSIMTYNHEVYYVEATGNAENPYAFYKMEANVTRTENYDAAGVLTSYTIKKCDETGRELWYSVQNTDGSYQKYIVYTYFANGNKESEITFDKPEGKVLDKSSYYEGGGLKDLTVNKYREDGTMEETAFWKYDETTRVVAKNSYYYKENETLNWILCTEEEISYDGNNTITTLTKFNEDGSDKAYTLIVKDDNFRTLSRHYRTVDGTEEEYEVYLYHENSSQWKEIYTYRKPEGLLKNIGFYLEDGTCYASADYYYNAEDELDWYYFREYNDYPEAGQMETAMSWYDADSNLIQYAVVDRDEDGTRLKNSYYDAADRLIRTEEYSYRSDGTLEKWVDTFTENHPESKRYPGGARYVVYICDETGAFVVGASGHYLKDGVEYMYARFEMTSYGLINTAYFYDIQDNLVGTATYEYHADDTNSPFELVTTKSETFYNANQQMVSVSEYYNTQISMEALKSYTEYTYDADGLLYYIVKEYNEAGELLSTTRYDADGNEITPTPEVTPTPSPTGVPSLGEFPEIILKENYRLNTTVLTSEEEANTTVFEMVVEGYYEFGIAAEDISMLHTAEEYMWLFPEITMEIESVTKYYNCYYIRFKNADTVYGIDVEHMYAIRTGDTSYLNEQELATYNELLRINEELGLDDMETDMEKIKAVHDYLVLNTAYDEQHLANDEAGIPNENEDCHYVEGTLLNGLAVCSGYASTFRLFMELQGIHCDYITNATHGWNAVELDGKWYFVDVTWDDPVPDVEGRVLYTYFMVPEDVLIAAGGHDNWSCECGVAHVCDSDDFALYPVKDYVFATEEEAREVMRRQAGQDLVTLIYPADGGFIADDLLDIAREELGITGAFSYYPESTYREGYNWIRILTNYVPATYSVDYYGARETLSVYE